MQYYFVTYALQHHVRQTMRHVVISATVDGHLSQSEYIFIYRLYDKINDGMFNFQTGGPDNLFVNYLSRIHREEVIILS